MKNKINNILIEGLKKKEFPGGQYAVVTKDKIITGHLGYKSFDPYVKCDGSEVYDCASLTKVISTTTLVFRLIEENKLALTTKISDVLEDFKHQDITVYDLLIHSSGLPADIPRSYKLRTREEVLEKVFNAEVIYEKGTEVVYSDIGYILLGLIVEKFYNLPIDKVAAMEIFGKLEMHDSSYRPDVKRAAPTEFREDEVYHGYLVGVVHDEKSFAMNGLAGHAGLFSSAYDIGLFIQSILNERFVLKPETVKQIFKSQIVKVGKYGLTNRSLGWAKPLDDVDKIIMHTGFTGCNMWIDLNLEMGFVLLTNCVHPKRKNCNVLPYRTKIRELLLELKGVE